MKNKLIVGFIAGIITIATTQAPAFAQVTDYVTEKSGVKYEYNKVELEDSILENIMGGQAKLYNRYLTEELISLKDDISGYIDVEDVEDYIIDAIMAGEAFNVDSYTEGEDAKVIEIEDVIKIDKDGNEINDGSDQSFRVISIK